MMARLVAWVALALWLACAPSADAQAREEARLSLVIGIQDYREGAQLSQTRADALNINAALRAILFAGNGEPPLLDADRGQILAAIDKLANQAAAARRRGAFVTVVVYFSGHGLGVPGLDNDMYLLPRDFGFEPKATLATETLEAEAVRLAMLRQKLGAAADQVVFLIDACRTQSDRLTGTPVQFPSASAFPAKVATLFAAQPGRAAPDDGLFSAALGESLKRHARLSAVAAELAANGKLQSYYTETSQVSLRPQVAKGVDTGSSGQPGQPSAVAQVDAAAIAPERLGTDIRNSAVLPELRDYMTKHGLTGARARAERGDATAQYMLGLAYSFGLRLKPGVALPEDWEVAADWLQKALLGGEIRAANTLGYIYWQGKIGPPNPKEAARIWTAAAERNVASSIANLATLYRDGTAGVPKDVAKAIELFERAGAAKNGRAYVNLGWLHSDSNEKDYYDPQKAVAYFKLADALNEARGAYELSVIYRYGNGTIKADEAEANKWLRRAVQLGHSTAAVELAERALERKGFGEITAEKAEQLAAQYERAASDLGDLDAMGRYADRLVTGKGVAQDRAAGVRILRSATGYGSIAAKVSLGRTLLADGDRAGRALLADVVAANFKTIDPKLWPVYYFEAAIRLRDAIDEGDKIAGNLSVAEFRAAFGPRKEEKAAYTTVVVPISCPIDGGGRRIVLFKLFLFDWLKDEDMVAAQFAWVENQRGCTAAADVKSAFTKLYKIALENKTSYRELVVYALGKGPTAVGEEQAANSAALKIGAPDTACVAASNEVPLPKDMDAATLEEKVVILLQGKNVYGDQIFTYLQLTLRDLMRLRSRMRSQCEFMPADFGSVLAAGKGEPSAELRARMTKEYNMIDVPRPRAQPAETPTKT